MILSICAIAFIATFFSLFNFRNKFVNVIMLYFYSVCMMMFISVLYVSKLANYTNIGAFDFKMYLWLSRVKINVGQINLLYNIAIVIFIFASLYFIALIRGISRRKILPLFIIVSAFYMYTNSHSFIWIVYSKINYMGSSTSSFYRTAADIIAHINTVLIVLAFILPFVCLFIYYLNTKIYTKKKNAITYALCLGAIDIYIALMFIAGAFPSIACHNLATIGMPELISKDSIPIYFPMFSFFIILFIVAVILYFKPFNLYVLVRRREIARNTTRINKNIRMTLHIHKNAFIGIEKKTEIARTLMESDRVELVSNQLSDIGKLANESIHRIERMLDVLREPSMYFEITDLRRCVLSAISKVSIPQNIDLAVSDIGQNISVYASTEHITEVFVNIIINAVEAIAAKDTEQRGKIEINVIDEDDIVAINFTDNGCGIPRSSYREIYKPFFSTKTVSDCGGIGLDYVKRVVKSHHGDVYVKSKVGVYTMFQVVLPAIKKEKNHG